MVVADDGSGDGRPLSFTAGEVVGEPVRPVRHPELLEGGERCADLPRRR